MDVLTVIRATVVCLAGLMFNVAFTVAAEETGHEHAVAPHKLTLDAGDKKWATDAPLRKGMSAIRRALATDHSAIHADRETAEQYAALAGKIESHVSYIVQNCKLKPEADSNLHVLIGQILEGADLMKGKDPKAMRRDGAMKVVAAVNIYPEYFDHPGWRQIR